MQGGPAAAGSGSSSDPASATAADESGAEAAGPEVEPEETRRRDVLQRLQGRDTQLESGLKV